MTIRMLVEGHSDPASAKRLGVSTRTYAGYIASLKDGVRSGDAVPARVRDGAKRSSRFL